MLVSSYTHGNNTTPRVFSTKTQDFTAMVLKSLVDVHLLSAGRMAGCGGFI